jgi:hypothetical protein
VHAVGPHKGEGLDLPRPCSYFIGFAGVNAGMALAPQQALSPSALWGGLGRGNDGPQRSRKSYGRTTQTPCSHEHALAFTCGETMMIFARFEDGLAATVSPAR